MKTLLVMPYHTTRTKVERERAEAEDGYCIYLTLLVRAVPGTVSTRFQRKT